MQAPGYIRLVCHVRTLDFILKLTVYYWKDLSSFKAARFVV